MIQINTLLLLIASSVLATIHLLATQFYLYWRFVWFDVPMHALGGMVAALAVFSLRELGVPFFGRLTMFLPTMVFVLLVALAWEGYEVAIGVPVEGSYWFDASIDLAAGLVGGAIGYFVGSNVSILEKNV